MFYLVSLLVFIPSPVVFVISSEAWAVVVGLSGQRPWYLLGPVLGLSQTIGFMLLYYFGGHLAARFTGLQVKLASLDKTRLQTQAPGWLLLGGVTGIPPLVALSMASPVVGVRAGVVFACSLVGRSIRFSVLAGIPHYFSRWANADVLPEWMVHLISSG